MSTFLFVALAITTVCTLVGKGAGFVAGLMLSAAVGIVWIAVTLMTADPCGSAGCSW